MAKEATRKEAGEEVRTECRAVPALGGVGPMVYVAISSVITMAAVVGAVLIWKKKKL